GPAEPPHAPGLAVALRRGRGGARCRSDPSKSCSWSPSSWGMSSWSGDSPASGGDNPAQAAWPRPGRRNPGPGRWDRGRGGAMRYSTSFGPQSGALPYSAALGAIAVLEAPYKLTPIGVATCVGVDVRGHAVWTLNVRDADVPGRWIVVDRQFRP